MAKERRWPVDQLVLMVLDLEVVSLTLKLPEVWGNTSKAGMVLDDLEVASCVLDLEVVAKEPGLRSTRRVCWTARCS